MGVVDLIDKPWKIGCDVLEGFVAHPGWIQAIVATRIFGSMPAIGHSASAGVLNPRVFRGLALRVPATAASVSALFEFRSLRVGKYWRSYPLVFSLVPRCQGL
jgi:hypothetical protein